MKNKAREALDAYYHEAGSWAEDQRSALEKSRRAAWIVAGGACGVAVLEALALVFLTPLKTVEPYTLLVDKQTGFVQALQPVNAQRIAPDSALTQSFLVQYVIARESFDINALQANYRKVSLWSEGRARSMYIASMQASNPDSPLARLPRSSIVETRVKSVSPLGGNRAMVRFDTIRRDANGRQLPAQPWVAVLAYRYSGEPMSLEDRFLNPLGFEVTAYQRNPEAFPRIDPATQPIVAAPNTEPVAPKDVPAAAPTPSVATP
ncbi:VirB8 family type IV secretion system protein [Sphingomonas sp. RS6]